MSPKPGVPFKRGSPCALVGSGISPGGLLCFLGIINYLEYYCYFFLGSSIIVDGGGGVDIV